MVRLNVDLCFSWVSHRMIKSWKESFTCMKGNLLSLPSMQP